MPKFGIMGGCSSCNIVSRIQPPKNGLGKTHRVFPKNKITGILECQIACLVESLADVATLPNLSPCFVLFLLRSSHFAKTNLDVGRELQSRSMEGTRFLFGKSGLVLGS